LRKNSEINNTGADFIKGADKKQKAACGGVNRILDANLNRASEGLRVCEEITRFILENHALTLRLKKIRHEIRSLAKALPAKINLIEERNAREDIGKNIYVNELKRKNIGDIFFANIQRVKESIRVLEEFSKLTDTRIAIRFKKIRYNIYEVEKQIIQFIKDKK
jgi:thiamine-phosphate pyrophosphorylase